MDPRIIVRVVMSVVLFIWVAACGVWFVRRSRRLIAGSGLIAHVVCERCGSRFDVNVSELTRTFLSKSRSSTKTKVRGGALVNEPAYQRFAKKVMCPHCRVRVWANVENVNELNAWLRPTMLRAGLQCLAIMVLGGALVLGASSVAMSLADRAAESRTQELREQLQEAFEERYGVE